MDIASLYQSKLTTPDQAVASIPSGCQALDGHGDGRAAGAA